MLRAKKHCAKLFLGLLGGVISFVAGACEVVKTFPAVLSDGVYCLDANVALDMDSPLFLQSNATLDCQGHRVRSMSPLGFTAVWARGDNVALKNCVIDGWAVTFIDVSHYTISGNTVIDGGDQAIRADGSDGSVKNNKVVNLDALHGHFVGIYTSGVADIVGNLVIDSRGARIDEEYEGRIGILVEGNDGGVVALNTLKNIGQGKPNGPAVRAIGRPIIYRNVIVSAPGITNIGLHCFDWAGMAVQNVIVGASVPEFHCPTVVYE